MRKFTDIQGEIAVVLGDTNPYNHLADYRKYAKERLESSGFDVDELVIVKDRGDGRRGKIDLVASKYGTTIAIGLENTKKNIIKNNNSGCDEKMILQGLVWF